MTPTITQNYPRRFALSAPKLPRLPGRVMDAAELALMLQVSPRTIRRLANRGKIPVFRVGSALRFDAARVVEVLGSAPVVEE